MTAADTPPVLLVGGSEGERNVLKGYLVRNNVGLLASVARPDEALPHLASKPECTMVLLQPNDQVAVGSWVNERRTQGFQGRVGVIVRADQVRAFIGKGRWNDFALKSPVNEPDFLGAARSASHLAERI